MNSSQGIDKTSRLCSLISCTLLFAFTSFLIVQPAGENAPLSAAQKAQYEGPLNNARAVYARAAKKAESVFQKVILQCDNTKEIEPARSLYNAAMQKAHNEFTSSMEALSRSLKDPRVLLALSNALETAKAEHQKSLMNLDQIRKLVKQNPKLMAERQRIIDESGIENVVKDSTISLAKRALETFAI